MEKVYKFGLAIDERRHTGAPVTNARLAVVPQYCAGLFKLGLVRAVRLSSHLNLQGGPQGKQRKPIHPDVLVPAK
jgi:hypothetical protein